jgi:hypothetical protein
MHEVPREIATRNVDWLLSRYIAEAESVGDSIAGLRGLRLLSALKRDAVGSGPYPDVTLFEAANRIMADLMTLHGEVFNVASSFFPIKKVAALKKLRASKVQANCKVIRVNHDAVPASYVPKPRDDEYLLFVNIETGEGRVFGGKRAGSRGEPAGP